MRLLLKTTLILSCLLCFYPAFGQNEHTIDSLLTIIKTQPEDTIKVNTFNELAWELGKTDATIARGYARQAIRLADSLDFERGRITGRVRLGQIAVLQKEFDTAEQIFLDVLQDEIRENYPYGIGRAQTALGEVYKNKGDLYKAVKYSLDALETFEALNNKTMIALASNNIGAIYKDLGNYNDAERYLFKSLELRLQSGSKESVSVGLSFLNIGLLYIESEDYDKAIDYLNRSRNIFEKSNDNYELAKVYNNLGVAYFKLENYDTSLDYYEKSLLLKNQLNLENKDPDIYNNIGAIHYKADSLEKAIAYYQKSLKLAEASNKEVIQLDILKNLSDSYAKLNQNDTAFKYYNRYFNLQDRIENSYRDAIRLSNDKEIAEISLKKSRAENKSKRIIIYSLIAGLLLTLFLFFSILQGNKQKRKAKKIEESLKTQEAKFIDDMIERQEEERKRIARDLHDRLGSMLAMVKIHYKSVEESLDNLKVENKKQYKKANDLLDIACEEVRQIAHDMISGVLMKFGLVAALEDLKDKLEETKQISVDFIAHGLDNRLDNDMEITIYRIVQELISNVLKHAKAKEITIQLLRSSSGLNIIVEDDGTGFDVNNTKKTGMGLGNVHSRVDQLNGEIHIDSTIGNGTTVTIDIPLLNN